MSFPLAARATEQRATAGRPETERILLIFLFFHLPVSLQSLLFAGPIWKVSQTNEDEKCNETSKESDHKIPSPSVDNGHLSAESL